MGEKKKRSAQEFLAAAAVAIIAAWAPQETGLAVRLIYAFLAVLCLLLASVGLELVAEWRTAHAKPKVNPFEVKIVKIDLPTAPPGGVFAASCEMEKHLVGFALTLSSDVSCVR